MPIPSRYCVLLAVDNDRRVQLITNHPTRLRRQIAWYTFGQPLGAPREVTVKNGTPKPTACASSQQPLRVYKTRATSNLSGFCTRDKTEEKKPIYHPHRPSPALQQSPLAYSSSDPTPSRLELWLSRTGLGVYLWSEVSYPSLSDQKKNESNKRVTGVRK